MCFLYTAPLIRNRTLDYLTLIYTAPRLCPRLGLINNRHVPYHAFLLRDRSIYGRCLSEYRDHSDMIIFLQFKLIEFCRQRLK